MRPDPFTLNAAFDHLISGKEEGWLDAARLLLSVATTISPSNPNLQAMFIVANQDEASSISGYAEGLGTVSVDDKPGNESTVRHVGRIIQRIGSYKVWHLPPRKDAHGCVVFRHFRTMWPHMNPLEKTEFLEYRLLYESATHEPVVFLCLEYRRTDAVSSLSSRLAQNLCRLENSLKRMWSNPVNWWRTPSKFIQVNFQSCSALVLLSNDPRMSPGVDLQNR
jgi:hypothetical protein